MRVAFLILLGLSLTMGRCCAQEEEQTSKHKASVQASLHSYVVQFTEFKLKTAGAELTTAAIMAAYERIQDSADIEVVETVRLSALEGFESMVQFGRRATVDVGVVNAGPGRQTRQTQQQMVGTTAQIIVQPKGEKLLLSLSYEASHFDGDGKEGSAPDTTSLQAKTTLMVEAGVPVLVAGATSYLVVTVK